jgi:hypothetical protein
MNLNELQLIAAGRVIDCLTQDPRAVLRYQHEALESNGLTRHDASRSHGAASHGKACQKYQHLYQVWYRTTRRTGVQ